jgi:hypothetical protein
MSYVSLVEWGDWHTLTNCGMGGLTYDTNSNTNKKNQTQTKKSNTKQNFKHKKLNFIIFVI